MSHDPFVLVLIQREALPPRLLPRAVALASSWIRTSRPTRTLPPADFEPQVVAKTTGAGGAAWSSSSEAVCAVKLFVQPLVLPLCVTVPPVTP